MRSAVSVITLSHPLAPHSRQNQGGRWAQLRSLCCSLRQTNSGCSLKLLSSPLSSLIHNCTCTKNSGNCLRSLPVLAADSRTIRDCNTCISVSASTASSTLADRLAKEALDLRKAMITCSTSLMFSLQISSRSATIFH